MKKLIILFIALTLISCGNSGITVDDTTPSAVDSNSFQATGATPNYSSVKEFTCEDIFTEGELSTLLGDDYVITMNMLGGDTCAYSHDLITDQSWIPSCQRKVQIKYYINDGFGDRNIDSLVGCEKNDGKQVSNDFSEYGKSRSCLLKAFNPSAANAKNMELKTGTISGDTYVRLEVQYQFVDNDWYANSNKQNLDAGDLAKMEAYAAKCPVDDFSEEQITNDLMKVTDLIIGSIYG